MHSIKVKLGRCFSTHGNKQVVEEDMFKPASSLKLHTWRVVLYRTP